MRLGYGDRNVGVHMDDNARPSPTPRATRATSRRRVVDAPVTAAAAAAWEHPRVLGAMLMTALVLPLLLVSIGGTSGGSGSGEQSVQLRTVGSPAVPAVERPASSVAARERAAARVMPVALRLASAELASTTLPATTVAPPDTTEPATTVAAPVVTAPPSTAPPTTAPPTTAAPVRVESAHSQSGMATYYAHNPGGCASTTVPRGTTVTVTASNGKSITCTVDDYGPFGAGRIIDLSEEGFARLAPLGTGVIAVTVSW